MPQNDDDDEGKGGKQEYVVKATFTDEQGKQWTVGTAFKGDEAAVRKALAAGRIAARPPQPEPKA